ncbi:competence protein CoiA family protein [Amycolatopsis sp. NPDC004169]|uniref:competence protein CoiA n=1 Tax=Amycolatopsis sp. NPDC004169 TaxID=3154453 RepID=UPI0033A551BB
MAFSALHPDAGRVDATLSDLGCGLAWDLVHKVRPRIALRCRECGHGVHAKVSPRGLRYFAHDPGRPADCAWLSESLEHHQLKLALATAVRETGWKAELEVTGPDGAWRADVLATSPDGSRRIAWEAQVSPITDDDIRYRTRRYEADDVEVCWVSPSWPPWIGIVPSIRVTEDAGEVAVIDSTADFYFKIGSWGMTRRLALVEFIRRVQDETVVFHEVLPRYRRIRVSATSSSRRRAIWASHASIDAEARHEGMRRRQEAWKQQQQEKAEARRKAEEQQREIEREAERARLQEQRAEQQRQWAIQAERERRRREEEERRRQAAEQVAERERLRQERIEADASLGWHAEISETRQHELRDKVTEYVWLRERTRTIFFVAAGPEAEYAFGTAVYVRNRLFGVLRPSPPSLHRLPRGVVVFALNAREAALLVGTGQVSAEQVVSFDFPDAEQLSLI